MKAFTREQSESLFWDKVQKSETCWEWTGSLNRNGYGNFRSRTFFPSDILAHRIAWDIQTGITPPKDIGVLHKCDNPKCVKLDHLFLGTQADNSKDMIEKGRHRRNDTGYLPHGHSHHFGMRGPRLSRDQAVSIRDDNRPHGIIANEYGIDRSMVSKIKHGHHWL